MIYKYHLDKEEQEEKEENDQITITEKIQNKIEDKNKQYKTFDQSWRNWIKENKDIGIAKETIIKILLKADFRSDEIEKEFNDT